VRGISELVTVHGLINLDFADVRSIMANMGMAMMGVARASGENRAIEAAERAISSPLLEDNSIRGARGLLINVTGGPEMSLFDVNEAASLIQEEADEDANIIFGAVIDENIGDEIRVTVIATGFGGGGGESERRSSRSTNSLSAPAEENSAIELQQASSFTSPPALMPQGVIPNGNGKPIHRLGFVDESRLDVRSVKSQNGDMGTGSNASPIGPDQVGEDEFKRPTVQSRVKA
jgi:cell division protein FtsZ